MYTVGQVHAAIVVIAGGAESEWVESKRVVRSDKSDQQTAGVGLASCPPQVLRLKK